MTTSFESQKEFIKLIKNANEGFDKKYHITTFGCQMNENDSEKLAGMLADMGYDETDNIEESDIIIYNTCCVRENAELKVFGHLGALKKLKREKPDTIIAVCGCMVQQESIVEEIKKKYRNVDLVFGTHNLHAFPELLYSVLSTHDRLYDIQNIDGEIVEGLPVMRKDGVKAWVSIMYGCNNFCSYCIVPYVRGRERSRSVENIVNEVRMLGQHGYKEITLLGQNVNSYGKDVEGNIGFPELLYKVNQVEGIERIRFMTSHPKDITEELIIAMKESEKVCEHLHLPLQSGSTRVLKQMNRKYTKEQYLEIVEKVKEIIPGIALTTDIIVGFPGETDEDFEETLDVIRKSEFDTAYTFIYSKREGTPAAKREDQVPEEVKKKRFEKLLEVQNDISKRINDRLLDKELEVLVEGQSKNNPDIYTGRTRTNKIVNFEGDNTLIGKLKKVKIEKIQTWSLEGKLVK